MHSFGSQRRVRKGCKAESGYPDHRFSRTPPEHHVAPSRKHWDSWPSPRTLASQSQSQNQLCMKSVYEDKVRISVTEVERRLLLESVQSWSSSNVQIQYLNTSDFGGAKSMLGESSLWNKSAEQLGNPNLWGWDRLPDKYRSCRASKAVASACLRNNIVIHILVLLFWSKLTFHSSVAYCFRVRPHGESQDQMDWQGYWRVCRCVCVCARLRVCVDGGFTSLMSLLPPPFFSCSLQPITSLQERESSQISHRHLGPGGHLSGQAFPRNFGQALELLNKQTCWCRYETTKARGYPCPGVLEQL